MNSYEQQRLANIEKNKLKLKELQLSFEASLLNTTKLESTKTKSTRSSSAPSSSLKKHRKAKHSWVLPSAGTRRSTRSSTSTITNENLQAQDTDSTEPRISTFDEYFEKSVKDSAIRTDGHYHGWLSERIMETYGIMGSAEECWEANGGGKFTFKNPMGNNTSSTSSTSKPSGWSTAKFSAYRMFKKNPNQYFYRHCEPGFNQNTGDWTEEEHELFLQTAKTHGCGDKWGLFASHIPNRVGYQCSNYYRQVILPEGLVADDSYRWTSNGSVVYVGSIGSNKVSDQENI